MNNVYLYDGRYSSLISLIETLLRLKKEPINIIDEKKYVQNLIDQPVYLKLNYKKEKINYLINKTSKKILLVCYYAFLSEHNNKEMLIYDFIKKSLIYKNSVFYRRNIDSINEIIKLQKKVSMEAHHIKGFLRFRRMKNNFYFAKINPTNNILYLVTNHFKERLKNEYFIIKDENRNIYALYDKSKVSYLTENEIIHLNLDFSIEEENVENLWKLFFKTIAIKERKNLKCQMNHMPKKYWKNIIEMEVEK